VANISVLPVQGELLALWEAGSPYRLDPVTLATQGRKTWSKDSDRLPFSAHPRVDRDGTIWSFGYLSGTGKIVLYRLDAGGAMRAMNVIDAPNADMIHDFAITERFLVFSLMPLVAQPREQFASALERYRWQPEQASIVLLIDKSSLTIAHRIAMPALMNFHLGNAWDDGQSVRVHSMRVGDYHGLMNAMYSAVAGAPVKPFASKEDGIVELVVDLPRAKVTINTLAPGALDFPAWDKRRSGQRTDQLLALRASVSVPKGTFAVNELVLIDQARGRRSSWGYGPHAIAEEHLFAPRATVSAAATDPGWIIGTHYNWLTQRTTLSVLDANHVADGPICSAQLPYGFPPGLHGAFVSA
jgi:all-trans-8'-apo-beta-carotenal 15,15'-oxygenase